MFVTLCFSPIKVQNIYETTSFYEQILIPNWGNNATFVDNCEGLLVLIFYKP